VSDDDAAARADVSPGDKVAGYLLEEQIGQGGMAVVYRAYDERLDRRVALKVLAPSLAADNAFRTRFIRESRAAATVEHPHIIPVYDAGDAGGRLFISMRYVQGGDVRSLLADGKALPPARAWNIINQVASALDMAHSQNLVHRDVKPANMLIDGSAKDTQPDVDNTGPVTEHIYLSDFGISKQTVASNLTNTGQFVGTLDYIAPEQIEGQGIDGRADQYSLACAAFELLTGAPPFTGPNIFALINSHLSEQPPAATKLRPELPPGVNRVLAKAMDKTPGRRYASCAQFAADLGRALGLVSGPLEADGGPTVVPEAGSGEQAKPPHQATELAGPAVAAAVAAHAAQDAQRTPGGAATAGPGAAPGGAGGPAVEDQQTMTAGQQGTAGGLAGTGPQQAAPQQAWPQQAGPQQAGPVSGGQQVAPGQQWQGQQAPSGQQWQAGPGQQGPYGQFAPYQTYPQPGGPSGPGWPQYAPPQQPAKRSRGPLIGGLVAAAAVIAAGAVVAVVVLNKPTPNPPNPSHSSSPAPTSSSASPSVATAQSQAQAVNNLLFSSEQSRHTLSTALINDVGNCGNVQGDVAQIQQVANQRSTEYNRATALQTDMIANGATLKSQLMQALKISLRIDNDYLAWAQQQANSGCAYGFNSGYYSQATTLDNQATTDKEIFVGTWNPVAQKYHLTEFQAGDI
jgi:tRNA A-37 threonylcarbamoyl transferase component Bud32